MIIGMSLELALQHLSAADSVMKRLVKVHPLVIEPRKVNLLEDIVSAIVSQQLSVKAADTIYKRFLNIYDGSFPLPGLLAAADEETLRGVGISFAKGRYIKGVAQAVVDGQLDLESVVNATDEEAVEQLVSLKGVGRWTAEMILIFSLYRPDIFSMGDLGLRTAISGLYGVDRDDMGAIEKITLVWKPYRSYASRLLWQSLDNKG